MPAEPAPERSRRSPLDAAHARLGATLVGFAGWSMPLRYSSELAEHRAVRTAAGVFDLSHMGEIVVRGSGAAAGLDRALVGDLSGLRVGQARYTMACSEAGGVLDDLVVYRRRSDEFLVVANAANTVLVAGLLAERAGGPAAEVEDVTDRYALVAIQGPLAREVLAPLTDAPLDAIGNYRAWEGRVVGTAALVARTGYTGEDGFELFVDAAEGVALFESLLAAGELRGVLPAGLAARDSLRLEAGMPLYGNELTTEMTPYEAGLGRVVRLDKASDFVGRHALEARLAAGPRRRLVGLLGEGKRAPRHGYAVLRPDGAPPPAAQTLGVAPPAAQTLGAAPAAVRVVGEVTSGAPSPTLGRPIAMAYVEPASAEAGTALAIDVRGRSEPASVVPLPFYRGARPRPATPPEEDA